MEKTASRNSRDFLDQISLRRRIRLSRSLRACSRSRSSRRREASVLVGTRDGDGERDSRVARRSRFSCFSVSRVDCLRAA